ncbi:adenylate/guanylate cyclase domain-containing protein [Microcoleus sp. FACHB-68]|uniref:adenylate/guanylate cyclase domain-containing protein n=1 Tax=Microcoleus sp. FACHB-68 TaxID=2692826 RepID=UPI001685765E|nr:adenylate/guanylate cyclase domain-containing protein [Microcoleus sp. FACHB-68]MBD1939844.1 CHASE domain-containing protein [Microcoleus sp. FACHB-68]
MPKKQPMPWSRYIPAGLTLCVGVGLSVLACIVVARWEDKRREYEFNRYADGVAAALQQHFKEDLQIIPNLSDFFAASDKIEPSAFKQFVQRPVSSKTSIQFLAWVPKVTDTQRETYEAGTQTGTLSNFQIVERNTNGEIVLAQQRPEYYPVYYLEPLKGNERALGFDLASQPAYRTALERARDTGKMVVTGKVELQPAQDAQLSLMVIQPIYNNQDNFSNYSPESLQGFVVGVFRVAEIFEAALKGRGVGNLDLYLADKTDTAGSLLNSSDAFPFASGQENRFLAFYDSSTKKLVEFPAVKNLLQVDGISKTARTVGMRTLTVGGREWSLYLLSTPAYREIQTKHWRSWAVLIIGLLWTHIPVTYLLTSLSRQRQIEQLAQERTRQAEQLQKALHQLSKEQEKSERLLLNILPQPIAERLKQEQTIIADSFAEVTVLFADIVGFTQLASRISATELVQLLNEIFSAFDKLAVWHGLEKIKTIGDAYMVVGGLPMHRPDHAQAIAEMALDMQLAILKFNAEHREAFTIRIGIHTGPVVAGVIGTNKFIYDLWGDTVNIANRMESHGIPGCIQISAATYERLQHLYQFEMRGYIPIKGKGEMLTYLLAGRQPDELSDYALKLSAQHRCRALETSQADVGQNASVSPSTG